MIEALDGDTEVIPGVTASVTGGHTHDHQVAVVRDGGDAFVHLADIVPTRSHLRGPWNQAYDLDALPHDGTEVAVLAPRDRRAHGGYRSRMMTRFSPRRSATIAVASSRDRQSPGARRNEAIS